MSIGFIGLGKMGRRMVQKLASDNHDVHVWNRTYEDSLELQKENPELKIYKTIEELYKALPEKIIWLMLPAAAVEEVLTEVSKYVKQGDIVIDGGNSRYQD